MMGRRGPKEDRTLKKITTRIYEDDYNTIVSAHPQVPYQSILRKLVERYANIIRKRTAQKLASKQNVEDLSENDLKDIEEVPNA